MTSRSLSLYIRHSLSIDSITVYIANYMVSDYANEEEVQDYRNLYDIIL